MNKILSIIIPSYNMEDYLRTCVDSLIVDNIDDIEIIIVNDGSKDHTLEIASSYQERFPNSIYIIDKSNGNYGSCINAGLKRATGKYIKVLDADDSFDNINFKDFIEFLKVTDADLIITDVVIVDENGLITDEINFPQIHEGKEQSFKECMDILSNPRFQMHAVTYRREILSRMQYIQLEGISYTDQQWMFSPMNEVEIIVYYSKVIYKYLVGREGQTVSKNVSYKSLDQTIKVETHLLQEFNRMKKNTDCFHSNYMKSRLLQKIPSIYRIGLLKTNDEELRKFVAEFDEKFKIINPELYDQISIERIYGMPIPYIKYWRKYPNLTKLIFSFFRKFIIMFTK